MNSAPLPPARAKTDNRLLTAPGWDERARAALERLIREGSGKHLPVIFDFDNTVVCGDIGEAVLAILARSGTLTPGRVPAALCPPLNLPGRGKVTLASCSDITEYYEAFLNPTTHGRRDPTPLANAYVWATTVLEGLRPADVLAATRAACALARPGELRWIPVTPGKTAFPAPFFYPEMVGLIGTLLRHEFDVWIVSASNVWSVRWMVLQALNPQLHRLGFKKSLRADHVIGIATLLTDAAGRLYKDSVLVREDPRYAALTLSKLSSFRLTSQLQFPVPAYSGKVGCIFDALGRAPYLCVGDSPADHPMLAASEHRLWIARVEKPEFQKETQALIKRTGPGNWIVQFVRTRENPGFVGENPRA